MENLTISHLTCLVLSKYKAIILSLPTRIQGESKTLIHLILPEISTDSMGHLARKGFSLALANYSSYYRKDISQEEKANFGVLCQVLKP